MISQGSTFFLQQAHQNNWQKYLTSLKPGASLGWDICVLTASDERQASMYRRQLEWRREGGVLPLRTRFLVMPDPDGRRIGSGGATLRALLRLGLPSSLSDRILLIHSGGDSRRLPHCSATGKLFARVPRELPDGRASTVFDEFLITLSGLGSLPGGVLAASGDVLLVFDHLQLSFVRPGVTGVAAAAPVETGMRHGVYATDKDGKRLRAYLHKPSYSELTSWGAVDVDGQVQIDTGLIWLDGPRVDRFLRLASEEAVANLCGLSDRPGPAPTEGLNLYGDLLLPLAESTTFENYLADNSDGPASPDVQAARRIIWERVRGIPFSVERLQPAVFVHLGTSQEYWEIAAGNPELGKTCGWTKQTASMSEWLRPGTADEGARQAAEDRLVLINAITEMPIGDSPPFQNKSALITDSHLSGTLCWEGAAIIASVQSGEPIALGADLVLQQLPVAGGGFVTRLFGMRDDPKRTFDDPSATFLNRPWSDWLARAGHPADLLWDNIPLAQRSLWNARLYPISPDAEESLRLSMPLQDPANAPRRWLENWRALERLSLGEGFARADGERILADLGSLEDSVAVQRFFAAIQVEKPADQAKRMLGRTPAVLARRVEKAAERLVRSDPLLQMRGHMALAQATGESRWEDEAFSGLASMIEKTMQRSPALSLHRVDRRQIVTANDRKVRKRIVRVEAAARIDFGGGWTDTPPYGLEKGGTVLNAAVTLRGTYPVIAEAVRLEEPRLILESGDISSILEPELAGEVLTYANPADPFALHKAAVVFRGIIPKGVDPAARIDRLMEAQGAGLRLYTQSSIPRGSGLGTSSILAGAVLACLASLEGTEGVFGPRNVYSGAESQPGLTDRELPLELFDEVLLLEQMLTTGGGWQDQVGGLTGGIKLITTEPGLPQHIRVSPVSLPDKANTALAERLVLVFTGQQRLAKNLLRGVMGRWMSRDPEMVWILQEIARLAVNMRSALESGNVDSFGELLSEHWMLNKRMDPGCTNTFIDTLFEAMTPYVNGAKLAGAGGGGFAIVVARSLEAVEQLRQALEERFSGTPVGIWPCAVPSLGMITRV